MMSDSDFLQANINPPSKDHPTFNHDSFDNLPSIIEDYHRHYYPISEVSSYISYVNHFLNDESPAPPPNSTGHRGFGSSSLSPPSAAVVTQERSCTTTTTGSSCSSFDGMPPTSSPSSQMIGCSSNEMRRKSKEEQTIVFRTKTELPVLDDGYKWRKYGKKMVKSNTNPRHYYKCVNEGCNVKKKIERDPEDLDYLITTYEGIHNHESPFVCLLPEDVASLCHPSSFTLHF
ncbi:PREDICTED: probable WRKY transcription factor 51 [Ipomoea nil]|uniref:probable WRKY transcription factor 51 n=1 Tax=Ipomoea nil TaxID=35883 RepID=UPI00090108ED|nr:PREDICTED: probable WRKY transcription factor 51 [Ipomoea nil]